MRSEQPGSRIEQNPLCDGNVVVLVAKSFDRFRRAQAQPDDSKRPRDERRKGAARMKARELIEMLGGAR